MSAVQSTDLTAEAADRRELERAQRLSLAALLDIFHLVDRATTLPCFCGELTRTVATVVGARHAAFWSLQADGTLAVEPLAHGFDDGQLAAMRGIPCTADGGNVASQVVFGDVIHIAKRHDLDDGKNSDFLAALSLQDTAVVAWRASDRRLGALAIYDSELGHGFSPETAWVLQVAALAAGMVWQQKQIESRMASVQAERSSTLIEYADRIRSLEETKSDFLKLASHELRGPLTVLRGYIGMMQDGSLGEINDRVQRILPVLANKLTSMNALVDQLLETARLEEGRLELSLTEVDVVAVAREVAGAYEPVTGHGRRVQLQLESGMLPVVGDRGRLVIIIGNLVDNAIKYSEANTPVVVRCLRRDGHVAVDVLDRGLGIAVDDAEVLFTRFGRIVTADNSHLPGTGLGLYLCRELARRHGGDLLYTPREGAGSIFTLLLPVSPLDAPAAGPGRSS